ncbi:hypothetical protein LEP1GSC133_0165 [Leptospira borgpetersenii serovar Pomona str. 200901868]|uniref:DUF5982 domain-containing protein n=1 Tax=Leptospira borgpetersenii serovar Pomona str. 200901868 TaxID=1192866 RepID=M6WER1_LEPBO|nr:hypothetical protein LEP1GSC133_0165 [Leptospira borgpetersenii serovar Pomona str. 200901868]
MYDLKTSVSTMTLRKLLIRRNENKNLIFKLQTFFVFLFYGRRKWGFRKFRKSALSILIFFGCAFVPYLRIFAQENFTGCDKPEGKKDLPFPIDRIKQMCKKDLNNKKEGWYPTGLPLVNSDPNEGIGYGIRVYGYNNGKKVIHFSNIPPTDFVFSPNILIRQKMRSITSSVWICPTWRTLVGDFAPTRFLRSLRLLCISAWENLL